MPRITKAARTSLPVKGHSYDLNKDFRAYANGRFYENNDSLIFWGDYCSPGISSDVAGYDIVGSNLSTKSGIGTHNIYSKLGVGLESSRFVDEESFCGEKCAFYATANRDNASGAGYKYTSSDSFLIPDHNDLSFVDSGNDVDFSISFWVKPKNAGGFNINEGGKDSAGKVLPAFFNKKNEYNLAIDESGRLRLTLYDSTSTSVFIYGESTVNAFTQNVWNNITVRYKSAEGQSGIEIFNNGNNITDPSRATAVGSYANMPNSNYSFTFGVGDLKQSSMPSAYISGIGPMVEFAELAIWKSHLSDESISAVYEASLTCSALEYTNESGYTSLSPRIRLRQLDNMTGSYPSVSRTGDRDFRGRYKIKFDDLKVIDFGEKIVEEFNSLQPRETFSKVIDTKKWEFTSGLEIRRESLTNYNGNTFEDGVLVFKGPGTRYLKTQRRVRNAIIEYELIQGPHNLATNILGEGLSLEKGTVNEVLKLQFSKDGTNWEDLKSHTPSLLSKFYENSEQSWPGTSFNLETQQSINQYRKKVRIHFSDIKASGSDYFLRFIQESTDRSDKSVWGIGRIEIISMNQDIRYPLLLNHDNTAGSYVDSIAIATPHTRSDLSSVGRSLPSASDHFLHFTPGENISPFVEYYAVENLDPTNLFHSIGTDPKSGIPGMSSRLADKTKIQITLGKDSTNFVLGHTDRSDYDDPLNEQPLDSGLSLDFFGRPDFGFKNSLIGYYKNENSSLASFKTPNYAYVADSFEEFVKEDVKIGIGTIDNVATRSLQSSTEIPPVVQQFEKDVLSNFVRPIKTFGFPFSSKFELNESDCIKASDYIDKPFVIEKIVVDFNAAFEFAANGDLGEEAYTLYSSFKNSSSQPGDRRAVGPRVIIPTFFILNQFKDKFKASMKLKNQQWNETSSAVDTIINTINYESQNGMSREMISYGQMTLYASSSENYGLDIEKLIDDGLGRDLNVNILEKTGQTGIDIRSNSINHFTSSFRLEFPCRVAGKTDFNQKIIFLTGSASGRPEDNLLNAYLTSDPTGGRNIDNIERGNRGLINNYSARKSGKSYRTWGLYNTVIPYEVETTDSDQIDRYSPYVLMPGDNLIFGWHYPPNVSYGFRTTGNSDQKRNIMRLLGKSEVYLYGSFLSNNIETHEYNNQPLTSNSIHEVIGSEKIVDDYQVGTRGAMSGSYIDRWVYFEEAWDHALTYDVYTYSKAFNDRLKRIGKPTLSIANLDINKLDYTKFYLGVMPPAARPTYAAFSKLFQLELSEIDQLQRFVKMTNKSMFFNDSVAKQGDFYPGSSYGTLQSYRYLSNASYTSEDPDRKVYPGGIIQKPIGGKYYFNYKHFGHFFDFYEQGKDSKIWLYKGLTSSNPEDAEEIDKYDISDASMPPVVTKFIKAELVDDSRIKTYKLSSYSELYDTVSDNELKPYNTDIYSTSSMPYKDERTVIFP